MAMASKTTTANKTTKAATANTASKAATANKTSKSLANDPSVKELLAILGENGVSARELLGAIGSVTRMEQELNAALKGLAAIQGELTKMREERDHPVKALVEKASRSLSSKVKGLCAKVKAIKDGIISGCKRAVEAFKAKGASALNNLAEFFDVKRSLLAQKEEITACIEQAKASIVKIEAVSEQYHAAGRALRNIGRVIQGKEPIAELKPNGALARLIEAPYRNELTNLSRSLRSVDRALASLGRLEKAAAKSAETARPSARETMRSLQKQIDAQKRDAPAQTKTKRREAAI
jgi:hypothetical protein